MTLEDRINRASELFKSGYNCSQSVVAAFADMYGFTEEQALRMAASFGGGIGRPICDAGHKCVRAQGQAEQNCLKHDSYLFLSVYSCFDKNAHPSSRALM